MKPTYSIKKDFSLDTMDIVIAVLLGVCQAVVEIFGLLGFLERTVWATGPVGFAIYAFYNGTTWILIFLGAYLRKRAMVPVLAVAVTALVRWFSGDPDGPILLFYALFPVSFGALIFPLLRWRGGSLLFVLSVAVTSVANQVALFVGQGGFQLADGTFWALVSMGIASVGGTLWGFATWYLGRGLEVAGVNSVDQPPSLNVEMSKSSEIKIKEKKEDQVIEFNDYSFWFDRKNKKQSDAQLNSVSLTIKKKSIVLLVGESGAGKSTLALNILGVYPDYYGGAYEGMIWIENDLDQLQSRDSIPKDKRFRNVNIVFQNPEDQTVCLTVEEEVSFALENYGLEKSEIIIRVKDALLWVGLLGKEEVSVNELSTGEKQRLVLASMVALRPKVLILDEPTSNLDPQGKDEIIKLVNRLRDELDMTIVLIEHEVDKVFPIVDEIFHIEHNKVLGPFTPESFLSEIGLRARDELGLWIPQASEISLDLKKRGMDIGDSIDVTYESLFQKLQAQLSQKLSADKDKLEPNQLSEVLKLSNVSTGDLFNSINLSFKSGEMVAIAGANGSGKSILGSIIAGIYHNYSGEVFIHDENIRNLNLEEITNTISYIFQIPEKQFVRNTVFNEIKHSIRDKNIDESAINKKVKEVLELVNLWSRRDASPYILSHGQKRRLSVASMIVSKPKVLILDEPTFGQDFRQAKNLMLLLKDLAASGTLIIFMTNDMKIVSEYANRVIVLKEKVIFDGNPKVFFNEEKLLEEAHLESPCIARLNNYFNLSDCSNYDAVLESIIKEING